MALLPERPSALFDMPTADTADMPALLFTGAGPAADFGVAVLDAPAPGHDVIQRQMPQLRQLTNRCQILARLAHRWACRRRQVQLRQA